MSNADVTQLLGSVNSGDSGAYERLLSVVHGELRKLAQSRMRGERPDHTLQPTALVNEVYVRLAGTPADWQNRAHFFGAAAQAMRRILVDHARKRAAAKRGDGAQQVTFAELEVTAEDPELDVLALDEALDALAAEHPRLGQVVHLRYFAGLTIEETAEITGTAPATVKRDWTFARAWLYERMMD